MGETPRYGSRVAICPSQGLVTCWRMVVQPPYLEKGNDALRDHHRAGNGIYLRDFGGKRGASHHWSPYALCQRVRSWCKHASSECKIVSSTTGPTCRSTSLSRKPIYGYNALLKGVLRVLGHRFRVSRVKLAFDYDRDSRPC